jgi:SUKH superfamily protein
MDWIKHISALSPDIKFNPPALPEEIRDAETKLNVVLPKSLKELWSQSNGLIDHYGGWFVWSTDEIVKRNLEMRTFPGFDESFMPFDPLLFFGDDGGGDLYFFAICGGKIKYEFVFRWDHETDSRILEEHHLKTYVEKFITALLEP